jgi:parvulin-like peptidyl-prolyl isomerase
VHAWEIRLGNGATGSAATGTQVEASRILYSPRGSAAEAPSIPTSDPSWAAAQQKAQATADKLRAIADPTQRAAQFAQIARTDSNDTASAPSGGDLGWFTRATVPTEFGDAVFTGTHAADEIIGPVQTQYGFDVILFTAQRTAATDPVAAVQQALTQPGADFAAIAKANSDATDAPGGGDMGWIARWQEPGTIGTVLFGLQPGRVSAPVTRSDGVYFFAVSERAQRPVDAAQRAALEAGAFTNWYAAQKAGATIWRSPDVTAGTTAQGAGGG